MKCVRLPWLLLFCLVWPPTVAVRKKKPLLPLLLLLRLPLLLLPLLTLLLRPLLLLPPLLTLLPRPLLLLPRLLLLLLPSKSALS